MSIRRVALWIVAAVLVIVGGMAALVVLPGTPETARSLAFRGFVALPKGKALTILDYMTVHGTDLFVTNVTHGDVYRITLNGTALPTAPVAAMPGPPAPHGVVIDPVGGQAFVTRSETNTVDVFDPATLRAGKRIPAADDADGIFYDPANRLVYAVGGDAKAATVIDPATQARVATIPLGGAPEFAAYDSQTRLIYQNLKDVNAVVAVDLAKRAVVQRWTLTGCQGPSGMAIDEAARRLFVACSANARLVVLNLATHAVVADLPVGDGPDAVAFDPGLKRLYVTGRAGELSAIAQDAPDRYRQLDRIRLHFGAHTLAVDPATHAVYVGYASLLIPARVAMFTAR